MSRSTCPGYRLVALFLLIGTPVMASDWAHWRGPLANGLSMETGLPSTWSGGAEGLLWRVDFSGRSTPVVLDGRVCANGRAGEGIERQEMVACFDAETGRQLWERQFPVYHTSVPWNRVGWANPVADRETGYLYVQGVGGLFFCLDSRDGRVVWSKNLIEEFGFMEGYGGRTQTPVLDEERLIVTFANAGWGAESRPLHRMRAFDKRTGDLLWVSSPASSMADKNSQSTPAVAVVDGQRLLIQGNGDGWIYAVQARTGEKVWGYHLSQRAINTSVLVHGATVFATHSEENVDDTSMGRTVAIDAGGRGDVTGSHEIWRSPIGAGFSSPTLAYGSLYVLDNSAMLHALDPTSGDERWKLDLGRVGKSSPVAADGRLYVTEVNGRFLIVAPGEEAGTLLSTAQVTVPRGRYAEIYGSPAISNGRIFFSSEEGLYCLGSGKPVVTPTPEPSLAPEAAPEETVALLRVHPAEARIRPGDTLQLTLQAYDRNGRSLGERPATWSLAGLAGSVDADGVFQPAAGTGSQSGLVKASFGALSADGRVRVIADLPLMEDLEAIEVGARPSYLSAYAGRFEVAELDGGKVLMKGPSPREIHRHITFLGSPEMSGYTIQADLLATRTERQFPDFGLINGGYTLELMGVSQKLQLLSWSSTMRMAKEAAFAWQPDTWYTMKLRVDVEPDRAVIRGKVWPRGAAEPDAWSIEAEDPAPIRSGSPGLSGNSPVPVYFDNIKVERN